MRVLSVTSAAASYNALPMAELSGSVTIKTGSNGRICRQVRITDRAEVSIDSESFSESPMLSPNSPLIYFHPYTRAPLLQHNDSKCQNN